jgi:YfiH family protein
MILRPTALNALPDVVAGFTTRAFAPPDEPIERVRRRVGQAAGFEAVASVKQVHGTDVATVREAGHVPAHDGLVTDRRGLLLTTVAADCALVLFADAAAGVVGACHSGWRGTAANIVDKTVEAMRALGAEPARLRAWVAPCISAEAFEVGEEVAAHFAGDAVVRRPEWPHPHVDLRSALRAQLAAAGLAAGHVEVDEACPALDAGRFYSYRAEGGTAGRMVGFVGLRSRG